MRRVSKLITCLLVWVALAGLQGCNENEGHAPIDKDGPAPKAISNPEVENLPGAAKITYELPQDKELLYVKAVYEIRPGVTREAKSAFYTNNLEVNGFGAAGEYDVKLYAVGRNEKISDPVVVRVNPSTPPVIDVFETIQISEDWGGVSIALKNKSESDMMIEVLSNDAFGDLTVVETFYTKRKEASLPVRGFEPQKRIFGVVVRDRWDNRSDTLFTEVTPWFEEEVQKPFKKVNLPTDYSEPHNNGNAVMELIWDGLNGGPGFLTVPGKGLPQWFTFDLGVTTKLSRLLYFQRTQFGEGYIYNSGAVKRFELYGSNDPNPDGSFDDSWQLLMECKSIKPSGSPLGTFTEEDLAYINAGEEFTFPTDLPPVRYLRWKTYENWGNATHINIGEISVFGEIQK